MVLETIYQCGASPLARVNHVEPVGDLGGDGSIPAGAGLETWQVQRGIRVASVEDLVFTQVDG